MQSYLAQKHEHTTMEWQQLSDDTNMKKCGPSDVSKLVKLVQEVDEIQAQLVECLLQLQRSQKRLREIIVDKKSIWVSG
tara:strand:- start:1608 stop:1844 length:237 start_codon:yes stop_codon:yes gene_type:complete